MANKFDVKELRQKALATDDIKNDVVYVEEWDAEFPVQSLKAKDLKAVLTQSKNGKGDRDEIRLMCLAVLYGCRTPEGERIFTDDDLAQFENTKAAKPIMTIGAKIMDISGFNEKAKEEAVKN
jgi:hypothetical protein